MTPCNPSPQILVWQMWSFEALRFERGKTLTAHKRDWRFCWSTYTPRLPMEMQSFALAWLTGMCYVKVDLCFLLRRGMSQCSFCCEKIQKGWGRTGNVVDTVKEIATLYSGKWKYFTELFFFFLCSQIWNSLCWSPINAKPMLLWNIELAWNSFGQGTHH